ncbi:hypothetical protein BBJ28_00009789 [Nothophytophthora sp. Chile5]|nr:hypothetical protein BBJ28_00009789 [Nothophytophthora sp. Chile5]
MSRAGSSSDAAAPAAPAGAHQTSHEANGAQRDDEELEDFAVSSDEEDGDGSEPALDDAMMNELLLVCSNLGMLRVQNEGEEPVLMRGEDCELWIHDLQRAIRRDQAKHKLVAKQLGKWKILQRKLLPLLVNHQHDWSLVFSILKVLVMLTMKPTKDSTNIAQQFKYLRQYKHEFLRHEIVPIMMTILVEPLSRKGSARTAQDYLNMEIVLTLIRNLLAIPNEDPRFVTSTTAYLSHLQEDLICMLHEENVYEMILLFTQDIDSAENREWNLLIMEMLDLTLDCSTPKAVVAYTKQFLTEKKTLESTQQPASTSETRSSSRPTRAVAPQGGDLLAKLNSEKMASALHQSGSRRHSNFGGIMTMVGPTGRTTVLSDFSKTVYDQVPQAAKKPTSRRRGKKSAAPITDINEVFGGKGRVTESDVRTMRVLQEICDSIVAKSYFQLTNSLKTEFRRGSNKLVSTDRLQYFHLVWFLTTYHRLKLQALKSQYKHQLKAVERKKTELLNALDFTTQPPPPPERPVYDEKAVLSTLDMFSFNFILQSIENYALLKNYHGMTVSVQLLAEMMAYLAELTASDDPRFQRIADSLQHKIFYERDFLDRLPVLLKTWSPGLFSMAYVVDVVTLTHVRSRTGFLVFKVLDAQGTIKVLSRRRAYLDKYVALYDLLRLGFVKVIVVGLTRQLSLLMCRKKQKKKAPADGKSKEEEDSDDASTDEEETERQAQLLMEMQRKEADFDVRKYFSSMVSSDTIKMYCSLLANYRDNNPKVNHYIHSFFYRAKHFKIHEHEEWTMQPILFNIHVLLLFNKMLQDAYIQRLPEFKSVLDFIRGVVRDFFALAEKNSLLFVECLLRQPYASKSCLLLQRNYEPMDSMSKSRSEAVALGREKHIETINETRRRKIAMDQEELEGEAEFQFTLEPSDFRASTLVAAEGDKKAQEDEGEAEFSVQSMASAETGATPSSTQKAKRKMPTTRAATERAKNWSKVEDRYLAKVFMKYRHLPSVYEVISYEDMFQDRDRTPEQIERRVKYLKLHRKTHDSSDEDEEEKEDGEDESMHSDVGDDSMGITRGSRLDQDLAALDLSQPRRRLRRGDDLSDDSDSDDEMLMGGGASATQVSQPAGQQANDGIGGAATNGETMDVTEDLEAVRDQHMSGEDVSDAMEETQVLEDEAMQLREAQVEPSTDAVATEMEAATLNRSQHEPAVLVAEVADTNPLKRSRDLENGEEDEMNGDSPVKKTHRAEIDAPSVDPSANDQ